MHPLHPALCRVYVAGKDMQERVAYVARGEHHPALYSSAALLQEAHWIAGQPPPVLLKYGALGCWYKARCGGSVTRAAKGMHGLMGPT